MDGIIVINKPQNYTSRDVVNKLTHLLNTKKIGHTGTLDPIATGVLVCCLGKYTKLVSEITSYSKEYIAEIKLGLKTDTMDITGNIIAQADFSLTKEDILKCFKQFPKKYRQTVPKYSAIKVKGKKLYEYARENIEVDLPQREVNIYELELLGIENDLIKFRTKVSKGTYIRSLIQDICTNLNVLGTMSSLTRTKQGEFTLDNAYSLNDIESNKYQLLKVEEFLDYPHLVLNDEEIIKVQNGAPILNRWHFPDKVLCFKEDKVIAIYQKEKDYLKNYIQL